MTVSTSKYDYQAFCDTNKDLPIFFQPWYLDGVCDWLCLVLIENNVPIGVLPYFEKRRFGMNYITMPPFVKHSGIHLASAHRVLKKEHQAFQKFIEHLPKNDGFKQNFSPYVTNWLPFYWEGFKQTTLYTYRLHNIQDLEVTYHNFNRNIRRNIKKATTQLTILEDLDPKKFYAIHQKSFDRQGLNMPYNLAEFLQYDASLAQQNARKIFYAIDAKQQIHSVAYLIWDRQRSYYHLSGDDPQFRNSGASILLVWHAIQYTAQQLNLSCFDFEGSMLQNIERIRLQFGAIQVPYFFIWKYHSNRYQWLDRIQKWKKRQFNK